MARQELAGTRAVAAEALDGPWKDFLALPSPLLTDDGRRPTGWKECTSGPQQQQQTTMANMTAVH